jgi:tetratricopeptide (TPR) repeat protein
MAIGDYDMAMAVFGEMSLYPYRGPLPHSSRFWEDVGLVAELAGAEDAPVYYAIGYITKKYDRYYPAGASSLGPLVLDVPSGRMPCYTSFGQRFHVAGSPLTYIAVQMNQMTLGIFTDQKMQAGGRALRALEIAERRNIRPLVCRALRGRINYYGDDFAGARTELKAAREGFRAQGEVDAGTSLLLGMLELQEERYQPAARYMEEAVAKDPASAVGWRSLGVVYVNLGLRDKALVAMDKSLEIQPWSVSGLYNRGLFHFQNHQYVAAATDLDRALQLDPENREIQRLLGMAGQSHVALGGDPADLPQGGRRDVAAGPGEVVFTDITVDPDSLLASLEAEIDGFFAVPDSLAPEIEGNDDALANLEARYVREGDPQTRKMLALAYIDRREFLKTQELLAPGWGVDLEPDEEIMLLYVDRMLGEQERARLLSEQLVAGQASTENPYVWALTALTIRDDPRAYDDSVVNLKFLMRSYSDVSEYSTSVLRRYSYWMMHGFSSVRASYITPDGDRTPMEDPWVQTVERAISNSKDNPEPIIK